MYKITIPLHSLFHAKREEKAKLLRALAVKLAKISDQDNIKQIIDDSIGAIDACIAEDFQQYSKGGERIVLASLREKYDIFYAFLSKYNEAIRYILDFSTANYFPSCENFKILATRINVMKNENAMHDLSQSTPSVTMSELSREKESPLSTSLPAMFYYSSEAASSELQNSLDTYKKDPSNRAIKKKIRTLIKEGQQECDDPREIIYICELFYVKK